MLYTSLLVAHIAVLGYWLGSELVINHTYRYVSWSAGMPFAERDRLMDHVMDVDQHVRYALVLQLRPGVGRHFRNHGFGGVKTVSGKPRTTTDHESVAGIRHFRSRQSTLDACAHW